MIENQFDASVRRSLWQTVFLVEENEALEYLGQTLELLDYQNNPDLRQDSRLSDIDTLSRARTLEGRKFIRPRIRISTKHGKATIEETSKYLQDKFRKEFSRSKLF